MWPRRSLLRLLLAGFALPFVGAPAGAAGVGLTFDLTLTSSVVGLQRLTGPDPATVFTLTPGEVGLDGDRRVRSIGMRVGQTVTAGLRRDAADDWSLALPARVFSAGALGVVEEDPTRGLASFSLYDNLNQLITLDFIRGEAFIVEEVEIATPSRDGAHMLRVLDIQHRLTISNIMDQTGMPMGRAGHGPAISAFSSLGPRSAVGVSRVTAGGSATAAPPPAVIPLPAALLFALTAVGATAALRAPRRG